MQDQLTNLKGWKAAAFVCLVYAAVPVFIVYKGVANLWQTISLPKIRN
jgi:hypothetical protein